MFIYIIVFAMFIESMLKWFNLLCKEKFSEYSGVTRLHIETRCKQSMEIFHNSTWHYPLVFLRWPCCSIHSTYQCVIIVYLKWSVWEWGKYPAIKETHDNIRWTLHLNRPQFDYELWKKDCLCPCMSRL